MVNIDSEIIKNLFGVIGKTSPQIRKDGFFLNRKVSKLNKITEEIKAWDIFKPKFDWFLKVILTTEEKKLICIFQRIDDLKLYLLKVNELESLIKEINQEQQLMALKLNSLIEENKKIDLIKQGFRDHKAESGYKNKIHQLFVSQGMLVGELKRSLESGKKGVCLACDVIAAGEGKQSDLRAAKAELKVFLKDHKLSSLNLLKIKFCFFVFKHESKIRLFIVLALVVQAFEFYRVHEKLMQSNLSLIISVLFIQLVILMIISVAHKSVKKSLGRKRYVMVMQYIKKLK